jgi:excisionase family DNA binding protein
MNALMTEEKIYTVKEVADFLRVSPRTVRKMIAERQLSAFLIRDEWRIRQSALDAVMQERKARDKKGE